MFKNLPTTNSLTSLDCVYSNFVSDEDQHRNVTGTYYSFHNALIFTITIENKQSNLNKEIELNSDDKMEINNEILQSSIPISNEFEQIKKRKKNSIKETPNKMLKTTNVLSRVVDINDLKEKQLSFLRNIDNIMAKNCPAILPESFTFVEQLDSIGFKKVDIVADGNCFFRAISHQLYRRQDNHFNIRTRTINYLISNMNDFASFIVTDVHLTIENYIVQMSKNGTYADHLAVTAAAIVINKNIIVHEIGKMPLLIPGSDFIEDQLHVFYDPHIRHYDSVLCRNGDPAFLSSDEILFP